MLVAKPNSGGSSLRLTARFFAGGTSLMIVKANLSVVAFAFAAAILAFSFLNTSTASAAPDTREAGTRLIMLGTSGGPTIRQRAEPSTLLIVDGRRYLIDCGVGALRRMVQAGIAPETVGNIFITHHHPDHDLDLANIMASDFFNSSWGEGAGTSRWNIYGPPGTKKMVAAAVEYISVPFNTFAAEGVVPWDVESHFVAHEIPGSGLVFQDDKIRITAVENTHFITMPDKYRKTMKTYSYRIQTPHAVIVFTGDTGPSEDVIKFAKDADVLVSEVIDETTTLKNVDASAKANDWSDEQKKVAIDHMKLEHLIAPEVARIAREAHVKAVVLYHLVPGLDADVAADLAGVKADYDGPVVASSDLVRYCIDGKAGKGQVLSVCD